MRLKSPVGWVGGKYYLASKIIDLFPEHRHYIEVFGGALHVLFAKEPCLIETVNDLDEDLINFWLVCRDHIDELLPKLEWTPYARKVFGLWLIEPTQGDPVERAARWFFLNSSAFNSIAQVSKGRWSASISTNVGQCKAQKFRSKIKRLELVRERLANVQIECKDFRNIIQRFGKYSDHLLYLDPPYVDCFYYTNNFEERDHLDLADLLNQTKAQVVLSYYEHPLILRLYKDWNFHKLIATKHSQSTKRKTKVTELLITNF